MLTLECYGAQDMSFEDLLNIDGGHEGAAYRAGHAIGVGIAAVGQAAATVVEVAAACAIIAVMFT